MVQFSREPQTPSLSPSSCCWCGRKTLIRLSFMIVAVTLSQPWKLFEEITIPEEAESPVQRFSQPQPQQTRQSKPPNKVVTLEDFKDLSVLDIVKREEPLDAGESSDNELSREEELRLPILAQLRRAGIEIDGDILRSLPTWSQVTELYGDKPVILGLETCQAYRDAVPKYRRFLGVAGQMNVGTNALFNYMKANLQIKENQAYKGIVYTVPWYKHSWVALKYKYMFKQPDAHDTVMPVVVIRDPYFWMKRYERTGWLLIVLCVCVLCMCVSN
jgi:hypothetical protein